MSHFTRLARSLFLCAAVAFTFAVAAPARAAMYVDSGLTDLKPEQMAKVTDPQPVQLVFQFQTKEKPNGRATKYVKDKVFEAVRQSGLFSEVTETPAANGAVLTVTLDNIPQEGAASKGFVTGLTFGLKSSVVTDYYVCTVEYQPPAGAPKIVKTANHSIHTVIGLSGAAVDGTKAPSIKEAVYTMTRQIVSNAVNSVGADPAFPGSQGLGVQAVSNTEAAPAPVPAVETTPAAPAAEPAPAAPAQDAAPQPAPVAS